MDLMQRDVLMRVEAMKLFERDGRIYLGPFHKWWYAKTEVEKKQILDDFKNARI